MICLPAVTLLLTILLMGFDSLGQQRPGLPLDTEISRRPDGTPELVRFANPATAPAATDAARVLRTTLGLGAQTELRASRPAETDAEGLTHQRYQQFYQGLPVEFTAYNTLARNGKLELLNGELQPLADGDLSVRPTLTAAQALSAALRFVHAQKYMWEMPNEGKFAQETEGKATFRPTGQLVIVADNRTATADAPGKLVLAWKFDIYATQPLSRAWVYVDAQTGTVVNQNAILHDANATGTVRTRYSGSRSLADETYVTPGPVGFTRYRLRDYTRAQGVETYNMNRSNDYTTAVDFTDNDNNWTAAEYDNAHQDWVAGDAHFGAQQTYDYWLNAHGRNSWDGLGSKIKGYVHYDNDPATLAGYDNAYWNGAVMTYGDGNTKFTPLTSLDVCAHEIGHGVCQATAGLVYQNEQGALNEGFSDIWGACVESRTATLLGLTGKNTWLIGEEITKDGAAALRSMSDPNAFQCPDTYQGAYWWPNAATPTDANDRGGVHFNSGVLNFWFYLLSQGGTGTNDLGNPYAVNGQGITKAGRIAYATEKLLSPMSNFASARLLSIQAATTLFGAKSAEVLAVTNAWYAVGVGASYPATQALSQASGYITRVTAGGFSHSSGNDGGYYDGTALAGPVLAGSTISSVSFVPGFTTLIYSTVYWSVWIDFNRDHDFADAGEQVVTSYAVLGKALTTRPFVVPNVVGIGPTRMRVALSLAPNPPANTTFAAGEVEDYTVTLIPTLTAPINLKANTVTATTAALSWSVVPGATGYLVRAYAASGAYSTTTSTTQAALPLSGLVGGQTYTYDVLARDQVGDLSPASAKLTFTTTPTYCASQGGSTQYEWIAKVYIGSLGRVSGSDGGYYFHGPDNAPAVVAGQSTLMWFAAGYSGYQYIEYWHVGVDWNNDGDFADANEAITAWSGSGTADHYVNLNVPANTQNGAHRLRVVMSDNAATTLCGSYDYGETEDYTLQVSGGVARPAPTTGADSTATVVQTRPAPAADTAAAVARAAARTVIVTAPAVLLATATAFPNPATDRLTLTLTDATGTETAPATVDVFDLRGARIQTTSYDGNTGTLQVGTLAPGLYTATLRLAAGTPVHVRFVKE